MFVPDFQNIHPNDLLELRVKLSDEILEMRHYILNMSREITDEDITNQNAEAFLQSKVLPSLKQLENKILDLKLGTMQKALSELKNPLSYCPLITTFFTNVPVYISLAISFGLIAADTILEYKKKAKQLETNQLFFTTKIRKHLKKHIK